MNGTRHKSYRGIGWFAVAAAAAAITHRVSLVFLDRVTGPVMGGGSAYARAVDAYVRDVFTYYNAAAFPAVVAVLIAYAWPLLTSSLRGYAGADSETVRRRTLSLPLVSAVLSFAPWLLAACCSVAVTLWRFGSWSSELMSSQVISPLVAGFMSSTIGYLLVEQIVRSRFLAPLFPDGRASEVARAWTLGVRARVFVLLLAVGFTPMFTVLGVMAGAEAHLTAGRAPAAILSDTVSASRSIFAFYTVLAVLLTLLLTRSLIEPLRALARTLRRVEEGDLDVAVGVGAGDEVGVLEDGVRSLLRTLREKEHILATFGRVVEPAVRDRLLSGSLAPGGELRRATVLFVDLRGFTRMAEKAPAEEVVSTLNRVFTEMHAQVRDDGGFVDKFIGDAMLAVFGLFADQAESRGSAADALRCAVGMRGRLANLNRERAAQGKGELAVTMGLHFGEVISGTIGAADRFEYTVVGDTVNVAARLQALCKEHDADLLASREVVDAAAEAGFTPPLHGEDDVVLRGRTETLRVCILS